MMKCKPLAYLFALSLALNAGVLGTLAYRYFTAPPLAPHTCPFASDQQHLYDLLKLSAEQRAALDPMAVAFHAHLRELQVSAGEQRDALLTLMEQEPLDIRGIREAHNELNARQDKVQNAVMGHLLDVKRILTPAQQKVFFQLVRRTLIQTN
jgi:Spy/CpxP family protein refolding chaperone